MSTGKNGSVLAKFLGRVLPTLPGFESLDVLSNETRWTGKVADYLFDNRSIVAEQKDVSNYKFTFGRGYADFRRRMIKKYGLNPSTGFARFDLLSEEEKAEVFRIQIGAMDIFKDLIHEANKQIGNTKSELGLAEASGLLILICDSNNMLLPLPLQQRVISALNIKEGVSYKYIHVDAVLVVLRAKGFNLVGRQMCSWVQARKENHAQYFGEKLNEELVKYGTDQMRPSPSQIFSHDFRPQFDPDAEFPDLK